MNATPTEGTDYAGKAKIRSLFNIYLFGKKGILTIFFIFVLMYGIGFLAPETFKTLDIGIKQAKEIAGTLIASYISVLSIGLAISAIILAIVQIANRQITLTHLIFNRSYFIPLVYFGLLNIILLGLFQLMFRANEGVFFEQVYIQVVIISIYCFALFLLLTLLVFYKTFSFLNFIYLIEEFLEDVYMEVALNKNVEYLSMRGREVYGEVTDAINKDDNVLVSRFLKAIIIAFRMNPTSTFLFEIKDKMAFWHKTAIENDQSLMFENLLSTWRELRTLAIQSENNEVRPFFLKVPARTLELLNNDLREPTFDYSLRLKEMIVYSFWGNIDENPAALTSYLYLRDIVYMVNLLLDKEDLPALEEVYNQFDQMASMLTSDIQEVRNPYRNNPATGAELARAELQEQLRAKIFYVILSIFSYYAYKRYYYGNKPLDETIFGILTKVLERYSTYYAAEEIRSINIPDVINWRDWVWALERRMDGKAYTIVDGETILDFGLLLLYLRFPFIRPTQPNALQQNVLEQIASNPDHLLGMLNNFSHEQLSAQIDRVKTLFTGLNEQEQLNREVRIAQAAINPDKLEKFRNEMTNQWMNSRTLYPLFMYYNALEINPEIQLQQVGSARMNLKDGRMMFIDGDDYANIYGIDWGKQVNREIERLLVYRINQSTETTIPKFGITEALDDAIVSFADTNGLIALIPLRSSHRWQVELINSGKYQNFEEGENPFPFQALGMYNRNIPVISIISNITEGKAIVLKLPEAVHYKIRTNENFKQNQLQVDILLHENKGAHAPIGDAPGDNNIPEQNAIVLIQEIMDFEVLDKSFIKIYQITE